DADRRMCDITVDTQHRPLAGADVEVRRTAVDHLLEQNAKIEWAHAIQERPQDVRLTSRGRAPRRFLDEVLEQPARGRLAVRERLRVPLYGDHVIAVVALEALDETVRRNSSWPQPAPDVADGLVVHAVDAKRTLAEHFRQSRSRRDVDVVRKVV